MLLWLATGCSADPQPEQTSPPLTTVTAAPPASPPSPAPATTRASPTSPVESTIAPRPEQSKPPVNLDQPSSTGTGLRVQLISVSAVEADAQIPGEIAGPALAITIEVSNTGSRSADLSAVAVTVLNSDEAPGAEMTAAPAQPLSGRVAAKAKSRGIYVFRVPPDKRRPITVTITIGDAPVLVFTGDA